MTAGPHAVWLALLLAALILLPRGLAISRHESERYDDEYHLSRGVAFWQRDIQSRPMNDPPLGEALGAVPLVVTGNTTPKGNSVTMYGQREPPETLLNWIAAWKSLLYLPLIAVAFVWVRELYGVGAAWLATTLLLIEPTFAAHIPVPAIDVLGAEGIVIACFAIWKYLQRATVTRLAFASFAVAAAMLMKNTALILPGVALVLAILWRVRQFLPRDSDRVSIDTPNASKPASYTEISLKRLSAHALLGIVFLAFSIWALTLFDVSVPLRQRDVGRFDNQTFIALFRRELPAGIYLRSIPSTFDHAAAGHPNFLNGERGRFGRWDYFPTVATYKLPVGIGLILLVGLASLLWRRPKFDEWSLALPATAWTALLLNTDVNIGFRHFLPALAFMLLLSSRAMAGIRWINVAIAIFAALAIVETLSRHPNYLSFTNLLRQEPYHAITDSNLDWGQGLKSIRRWASRQKRPVSLAFFGSESDHTLEHYLADTKVRVVLRPNYSKPQLQRPLPTTGLFIVSPTCLAGSYDPLHRLDPLWSETPIDTIDHSLLVYDLDEILKRRPNLWAPSVVDAATAPTTR